MAHAGSEESAARPPALSRLRRGRAGPRLKPCAWLPASPAQPWASGGQSAALHGGGGDAATRGDAGGRPPLAHAAAASHCAAISHPAGRVAVHSRPHAREMASAGHSRSNLQCDMAAVSRGGGVCGRKGTDECEKREHADLHCHSLLWFLPWGLCASPARLSPLPHHHPPPGTRVSRRAPCSGTHRSKKHTPSPSSSRDAGLLRPGRHPAPAGRRGGGAGCCLQSARR